MAAQGPMPQQTTKVEIRQGQFSVAAISLASRKRDKLFTNMPIHFPAGIAQTAK